MRKAIAKLAAVYFRCPDCDEVMLPPRRKKDCWIDAANIPETVKCRRCGEVFETAVPHTGGLDY